MADCADSETTPESADSMKSASPADAETSPIPEISGPMLDVHAPNESIHTWKSFCIHIATIVIGLFIAVGLEQTVEFFHHRHQLHMLREDLQTEAKGNQDRAAINLRHIDLDLSWLLELHNRIDALRAGQAKTSFAYPAPPSGYPGDPEDTDRALFLEAVWNNARQAALIDLLPPDEAQFFSRCYLVTDLYVESFNRLARDWEKITSIEFQFQRPSHTAGPDVERMSPAQLDQYAAAVAQVFMSAQWTKRVLLIQQAWNSNNATGNHTQPDIGKYLRKHADRLREVLK